MLAVVVYVYDIVYGVVTLCVVRCSHLILCGLTPTHFVLGILFGWFDITFILIPSFYCAEVIIEALKISYRLFITELWGVVNHPSPLSSVLHNKVRTIQDSYLIISSRTPLHAAFMNEWTTDALL